MGTVRAGQCVKKAYGKGKKNDKPENRKAGFRDGLTRRKTCLWSAAVPGGDCSCKMAQVGVETVGWFPEDRSDAHRWRAEPRTKGERTG